MKGRMTRTARWILRVALAGFLLGAAVPARAQFLKNLQKYTQKAQDVHKSMTVSVDQEKDIGREVAAKMVGFFHLYNDPGLTQYVNLVGQTVAAQSPRKDIQFHFAILDSDGINAFSAPGGFVFITRGALALCDDESELAGVLAHEVAHISEKHVIHVVEHDKAMQAGMEEAQSHMKSNQYTEYLQNMSKNILVKIVDQGLAPADEYDADEKGVMYAHAAGYPADGLERFLTKLDQATQQGGQSFWTRTHPPVADRNAKIQQEIASNNWQDADRPKLADRYAMAVAAIRPKS
jgi:predicted Zn-dependent protease